VYRCLWWYSAATASSVLAIASGDSTEVAVELSVADSQSGDGGDKGPVVCLEDLVCLRAEVSFLSMGLIPTVTIYVYLFIVHTAWSP